MVRAQGRVAVAERSDATATQPGRPIRTRILACANPEAEPQRTQRTQRMVPIDHEGHEVHEGNKCDGWN
jgi:hypothetical protein